MKKRPRANLEQRRVLFPIQSVDRLQLSIMEWIFAFGVPSISFATTHTAFWSLMLLLR